MNMAVHTVDERNYIETVYTSHLGSNIARTTGTISVVSSAILIAVILRSSVGLSSVYHRIMFCMSLADIIASIAIALTTIPMPKDMIYTQFESTAYGTTATCSVQGFFFTFGSVVTFGYNTSLCIYYLCAIRYKMKDLKFRKRIEPWLHFICLSLSLQNSVIYLFGKTYNPSPIEGWCTTTAYPWVCGLRSESKEECEKRNVNAALRRYGTYFALFGFFVGFILLIGSMALIIWSVYRQERLLKAYITNVYGARQTRKQQQDQQQEVEDGAAVVPDESKNLASSRSRHRLTKVILYQALAYVLAFLICQSNVFVSLAQNAERTGIYRKSVGSQVYHLVTRPLQGFFNLIVFLGHKVYNLRQVQREMSNCQALWHVLTVREEPKFVFSRISLVANAERDGNEIIFDGDDDDANDNDNDATSTSRRAGTEGNASRKQRQFSGSGHEYDMSSSGNETNQNRGSINGMDGEDVSVSVTSDRFQEDYGNDGASAYGPLSWFSSRSSKSGRNNGSSYSNAGVSWETSRNSKN
jgi:hypothetical protein